MKKKNLFVGLLLASAVFSLAACTDKKPAKTDDKTTDVTPSTQSTPVTPTSDKPSTPTSDKPTTPTSDKPTTPTSTTPVVPTTTEEGPAILALKINTSAVKVEYEKGDKLDLTGLVVEATFEDDARELTADEYTVTIKNSEATEVDVDAALEVGNYTVTIAAGGKSKDFSIVVKAAQYTFDLSFKVNDYAVANELNNTTYTADKVVFMENKSFELSGAGTALKLQITDSNGNPVTKTYNEVDYESRLQVNASKGTMTFGAKASGKVEILFSTDAGRTINATTTINGNAVTYKSEAPTAETKENIHSFIFPVEANQSYDIVSSSGGGNIYALIFHGSVDATTRVATDDFEIEVENEYNITDNKFNPANFEAKITATDNYGVSRSVDLADCTVTVKNSAEETVTGEITTPGVYSVTVAYDGKEVVFGISVSDPNAAVTALILDTDTVIETFYEGDTFDYNGLTVEGKKGAVNVSLTAEEYTVELLKGTDVVTAFSTEGDYTVRVTYNEDTNVTATYTIRFYTISKVEYTAPTALNVKIGTNDFYVPGLKAIATYGDETTKDVTDNVEIEINRDDETVTAAEAFATAGEADVVLRYMNHAIPAAIAVTVKAFEATDYNFESKTATTGGTLTAGTEIISNTDFVLTNKGINADYLKDKSTATATDGATFNMAVVTTGGMADNKIFEFKALNDTYVTIYFTITDGKFGEKDQAKGGELMINNKEVVTVNGSKSNTIAYSYTAYVAKDQTISFRAGSNRLALFGLKVEK